MKEAENDLNIILEYQNNNKTAKDLLSAIIDLQKCLAESNNDYADENNIVKRDKLSYVMNMIKDGLNVVETITSCFGNVGDTSYQNSRNSIGTSYGAGYSKVTKKESCSSCNGTGKNLARERPSFYNHTTEDYMSSTCGICGSSSNHYHKDCPSCGGKGMKITF